jgi:RimJ/RimL family protein N-acetyltransferase
MCSTRPIGSTTPSPAVSEVRACEVPPGTLLARYRDSGAYADCYATELPRSVSHPEFVHAFYTTGTFKLERAILRLVSRPSTDADALELSRGERESFAAWTVEGRARNELLLCDYLGRTRSWLMVENFPDGGAGARLHFGSAVVPKKARGTAPASMGAPFNALLGFHKVYSRILLRAAASRLASTPGAAALRRFRASDLSAFQAYRNDAEVGRYQGWSLMSDPDAAAFLAKVAVAPLCEPGAWCQLAIADPRSDLLLGDIGLFLAEDGSYAEVGVTLARAAQGRGIAASAVRQAIELAFANSGASEVRAGTDERNTPCARLLERLGMRRVGSRQATYRGEPCVDWLYAIQRSE